MKNYILSLLMLLFSACGGSGSDNQEAVPEIANPVATRTEIFGENGNLYKPRSADDSAGTGNMVVLLNPVFTKQFDSCEIRKSNGETGQLICINDQPWTHVPYSCFSNGNRQTWRANFPCEEVAEVKVICKDFHQEVTFTVPDSVKNSICTRFG